jgi:hypothetical protein
MTQGVPTPIDPAIENDIVNASTTGLAAIAAPGRPVTETSHVIKYTTAEFGGGYPPAPKALAMPALHISPSPGFTWGAALYVCPVAYPISSGIYGRCGVVAQLADPTGWRLFNAANPVTASLYVDWTRYQPMSNMLMLTTHSQLANQLLRNAFRRRFRIDAVVFQPDEMNHRYTDRRRDRWLAVTEWSPSGRLITKGPSSRATSPRLSVILAEEFVATKSGIGRHTRIGPTPGLAATEPTPSDLINAYAAHDVLMVSP